MLDPGYTPRKAYFYGMLENFRGLRPEKDQGRL